MTVTINGTSGITDVDGTAAAPALTGTDTDTGIFFPAANTVAWGTNGTERMRLDSSGNLGLGVTPSAWGSGRTTLQLGGSVQGTIAYTGTGSATNGLAIWNNAYYGSGGSGTANYYVNNGTATIANIGGPNAFAVSIAASGTAGNVATFTTAMTLDSSGRLMLGTTTPDTISGVGMTIGGSANGTDNTAPYNNSFFAIKNTDRTTNNLTVMYFDGLSSGGSIRGLGAIGMKTTSWTDGAINSDMLFWTSGSGTVAERARIDSSGNLGLGVTPSGWPAAYRTMEYGVSGGNYGVVWGSSNTDGGANAYGQVGIANNITQGSKYAGNGAASYYLQSGGRHSWYNAASGTAGNAITFTQAMTLDASGNLLVGGTSNAAGARLLSENAAGNQLGLRYTGIATWYNSIDSSGNYIWTKDGSEKARIDSSGNLLVGTTTAGAKLRVVQNVGGSGTPATAIREISGDPYGLNISYGATPNGPDNYFILASDNSAARFYVKSNGGIANYSANNSNLSDERTKTDIQDAGGYLAKICAIPVRTFKYKDQTDDLLNLGVIAQEVEVVAPELVDVCGFGETPEDGVPLKAIYQTDLQYALMKCIQEQQAIIESLKARLDAANI